MAKSPFEFNQLKFTDVIYIKNLIEIKKYLAKATGCGLCITDHKGNPVTDTEIGSVLCKIYNHEQKIDCFLCQSDLMKKTLEDHQTHITDCEALNMQFAVIPVFIKGTCLGFFFLSSKSIKKDIYTEKDIKKVKVTEDISREKFLINVELVKVISKNIAERAFLNYLFIGELVNTMELLFSGNEQKQLLNTLNNHSIIGTSHVSLHGMIFELNDRFCEILGYKKQELIGQKISNCTNETDKELKITIEKLKRSEQTSHYLEKEFVKKDGSKVFLGITTTLISRKDKSPYLFSLYHDITDKVRFEEKLISITKFTTESPNPILRVRNDGLILYMNPACKEISEAYGFKLDDYGRKDLSEVVSKVYRSGKPFVDIIDKNRKFYRFTYVPSKEYGYVNIFITDITELKIAEEYALDNERRYKAISEASFETLLIHENEKILEINNQVENMFGYKPDDIIGENPLVFIAEELRDEIKEKIENNKEELYESICVKKNGKRFFVRIHGKPYIYKGENVRAIAIEDIDDMKRFEISTKQALKKVKDIINMSPLGIFIFELNENGQLIFIEENQSAKEMTGVNKSDDYGKPFEVVFPYMKESDLGKIFKAVAELGRSYKIGKYEYNTPSVDAVYEIAVFQTEPGRIAVQMMDITEGERYRKKIENLNVELEKKVEERTRQLEIINSELENFSNMVSHDLKSPLNIISGYADMLEIELAEKINDKEKVYIEKIHNGISRMGELINDILRFSKINQENIQKEEFDMSKLVNEIFFSLMNENETERYKISIEENIKITGDKRLLSIVLENIIGNALKYSSKTKEPHMKFYQDKIKDMDYLVLEDNGVGFPSEMSKTIFEPLKRAHKDNEFPGTGIGLATAQKIIKKHGGEIFAESDGKSGAKFYFRFD